MTTTVADALDDDRLGRAVLAGLRHAAAPPASRHTPALDASISAPQLFEHALRLGLVPLIAAAYQGDPRIADPNSPFSIYMTLATAVFCEQIKHWRVVADELIKQEVSFIVLKGFYIMARFHRDNPRLLHDIDLLVRPDAIERVRLIIPRLGFWQAGAMDEIREVESTHYELAEFAQWTPVAPLPRPAVKLARRLLAAWDMENTESVRRFLARFASRSIRWKFVLDVHHNVIGDPTLPTRELWLDGPQVSVAEMPARTLRPSLHVWLLCRRIHTELGHGDARATRMLADLLALVRNERVAPSDLQRLCQQYGGGEGVHEVLSMLRALGADIPFTSEWRRYRRPGRSPDVTTATDLLLTAIGTKAWT